MDFSFSRFDKRTPVATLPSDLAVLMVEMVARQAASPTAAVYVRSARVALEAPLFAPVDGAFNGAVARSLMKWKDE